MVYDYICQWLLNTLSDSLENLRVTLTNYAPSGVMIINLVKIAILNEVRHQTQQALSSQAEIFWLQEEK